MKKGVSWSMVIVVSLLLALILIILVSPLFGEILILKDAIFGIGP